MAKKKAEEKINIDSILFKCRDILRAARNSGSFFEKRDMMLTLVFLRFIGEKFEDGVAKLREDLIAQGLDPDDEEIFAAFFDDATFTDGTYNLPIEARWSTIINTPAPQLNVALDTALHSIATSSNQLRGCFVEGTFTTRNLAANDIKKIVDEVNKISHKAFGEEKDLIGHVYEYFLKEFAVNATKEEGEFRVDTEKLLPEYLAMWLSRQEFDRYARFHSWGSARENFTFADMGNVQIPMPSVAIQKSIVNIYTVYKVSLQGTTRRPRNGGC